MCCCIFDVGSCYKCQIGKIFSFGVLGFESFIALSASALLLLSSWEENILETECVKSIWSRPWLCSYYFHKNHCGPEPGTVWTHRIVSLTEAAPVQRETAYRLPGQWVKTVECQSHLVVYCWVNTSLMATFSFWLGHHVCLLCVSNIVWIKTETPKL